MLKGRKTRPVDHVFVLSGSPILGQESIAAADNLSIKIGGELRPVICQAPNPEIAAKGWRSEIHILKQMN